MTPDLNFYSRRRVFFFILTNVRCSINGNNLAFIYMYIIVTVFNVFEYFSSVSIGAAAMRDAWNVSI